MMTKTFQYCVYGALFGALFPVVSTSFDLLIQGLPLTLSNAVQIQRDQPLHWVIDSAPVFLGLFAGLAGRRQDAVIVKVLELTSLNARLHQEQENLASLSAGLRQLFDDMPLGAAAYGAENNLLSANLAFAQFVERSVQAQTALEQEVAKLNPTEAAQEISLQTNDVTKYCLAWRVDLVGLGETRYWILLTDVTTHKAREKQLVTASKLAVLGELAAGTAHELNQPLNHIRLVTANLSNLLKRLPADTDVLQTKVDAISGSVMRAGKIIDHMRSFGRSDPATMEQVSIESAVKGALILLTSKLHDPPIQVEINLAENLPPAQGVESQLEQVFINILANAIDAIRDTDPSTKRITIAGSFAEGLLSIRVRDTGGGLSDTQMDKLFVPFFTTKEVGKGTGLGGSISYGIVKSFGGNIVVSNWERGAEITVSLPVASRT